MRTALKIFAISRPCESSQIRYRMRYRFAARLSSRGQPFLVSASPTATRSMNVLAPSLVLVVRTSG
jgi:hypothetical protein